MAVVGFRVEMPGSAASVAVHVSEASRWHVIGRSTLKSVHSEYVDRRGPGSTMQGAVETGDGRVEMVGRPDGLEWWRTFGEGKDSPAEIFSETQQLQCGRIVKERWLRDGDPVSVIGSLQTAEDGKLLLVAGDSGGYLTNLGSQSRALAKLGSTKPETQRGGSGPGDFTRLKMVDSRCRAGVAA